MFKKHAGIRGYGGVRSSFIAVLNLFSREKQFERSDELEKENLDYLRKKLEIGRASCRERV